MDPIGSAGTYDSVVLVEMPRPWPSDIGEIPGLTDAVHRDPRCRVLAVVPRSEDESGLVRVVQWKREPHTTRYTGVDHRAAPDDVPDLLTRLIDDPDGDVPEAVSASPPDVVLCGHGSRDRCCGKLGTLLHGEVRDRWERIRTWQCSHTGGHRFAPTGLTFPEGRSWAFLDADLLDSIVDRTAEPSRLRGHYRGSLALDRWTQAVEREAFCRLGWDWLGCTLVETSAVPSPDGRSCDVRLTWSGPAGDGGLTACVGLEREIPIFPCGTSPVEATKTSPELVAHSLEWSGSTPPHRIGRSDHGLPEVPCPTSADDRPLA